MEEWRDIAGYEGVYQVSNQGRVKSLARTVMGANCHGNQARHLKERILKCTIGGKGYLMCGLYASGRVRHVTVHALVAEAFLENPDNLPLVRHLNDKKTDNRASNLAWGTYGDNAQDAVRNGRNYHKSLTHCKWGHEYTDENTCRTKYGRDCRRCRHERNRAAREKRDKE